MADAKEVKVPDIGDFSEVPVIEILVSAGDEIDEEAPVVTLESDKATMDVPAPFAGKVVELKVDVGDKVSEGDVLAMVEAEDGSGDGDEGTDDEAGSDDGGSDGEEGSGNEEEGDSDAEGREATAEEAEPSTQEDGEGEGGEANKREDPDGVDQPSEEKARQDAAEMGPDEPGEAVYATPSVRKLGRELGVDLSKVKGTGRKG